MLLDLWWSWLNIFFIQSTTPEPFDSSLPQLLNIGISTQDKRGHSHWNCFSRKFYKKIFYNDHLTGSEIALVWRVLLHFLTYNHSYKQTQKQESCKLASNEKDGKELKSRKEHHI